MKLKKLLAGFFTVAALLLVMSLSAFAEETTPSYTWYTDNLDADSYTINSLSDYLGFVKITQGNIDTDGDGEADITKSTFNGKTVNLNCDIDFSNMDFYNTTEGATADWRVSSFQGSFNGNNHSVKNIKYTVTESWNGSGLGIFRTISSGAEIKNLIADTITVNTNKAPCAFGGIVYYANTNTRLTDCTAKNITYISTGDLTNGYSRADNYNYWIRTENEAGGIAAVVKDACEVTGCKVENFSYTSENYICALGGLIGRFYMSNAKSDYTISGLLENCSVDKFTANVKGLAGFDGKAKRNFSGFGGMLGYGYSGNDKVALEIKNCHVTNLDATIGDMETNSFAGGFVGMSRRKYNATDCSTQGKITVGASTDNQNCFVGGFAGAPLGGDCTNMGDMNSWPTTEAGVTYIRCTADVDINATGNISAGGFVGLSGSVYRDDGFVYNRRFDVDYNNCSAKGEIESEYVGGAFAAKADRGNFNECDSSEASVKANKASGFIEEIKTIKASGTQNEKITITNSVGTSNLTGIEKTSSLVCSVSQYSTENIEIDNYKVNNETVNLFGEFSTTTDSGYYSESKGGENRSYTCVFNTFYDGNITNYADCYFGMFIYKSGETSGLDIRADEYKSVSDGKYNAIIDNIDDENAVLVAIPYIYNDSLVVKTGDAATITVKDAVKWLGELSAE